MLEFRSLLTKNSTMKIDSALTAFFAFSLIVPCTAPCFASTETATIEIPQGHVEETTNADLGQNIDEAAPTQGYKILELDSAPSKKKLTVNNSNVETTSDQDL